MDSLVKYAQKGNFFIKSIKRLANPKEILYNNYEAFLF